MKLAIERNNAIVQGFRRLRKAVVITDMTYCTCKIVALHLPLVPPHHPQSSLLPLIQFLPVFCPLFAC